MPEELKPCPFCGGEASLFTAEEVGYIGDEHFAVKCNGCFCGTGHYADPGRATEAWNRRAQQPNEALTVDELRQMIGSPIWISGLNRYGILGRKGIDADDDGKPIYCYVVGFAHGWEWIEDVLADGRKAYRCPPEAGEKE